MASINKTFVALGCILMTLGTMIGAFGTHSLEGKLAPAIMAAFESATQYHFINALGLIAVGILAQWVGSQNLVRWAGWLLVAGIAMFSGSIYLHALTDQRFLVFVTPLGGLTLMLAWLLVAIAVLKK